MRLHEEFGLSVSDDTIYRALHKLGFSHLSARPRAYKQDAEAIEAFKKRMARPVCKGFVRDDLISLRQRIRPVGGAPAKMEIRASRSS
jgi:Winged helix-turn helix